MVRFWVRVFLSVVVFACQHCPLTINDERKYLSHSRMHLGLPNFNMVCPLCGKKFVHRQTFRRHIKSDRCKPTNTPPVTQHRASVSNATYMSTMHTIDISECGEDLGTDQENEFAGIGSDYTAAFDPRQAIGSMISELCFEHNVPGTVSSLIARRMGDILKRLSPTSGPASVAQHKRAVIACTEFQSSFKLKKFSVNLLGYVAPITILLSDPGKLPKASFQYVSVKGQLSALLKQGKLSDAYIASRAHATQPGTYSNVWDGKLHEMNRVSKDIYILLYYDDFQLGNVLGPNARKMKIGAMYFTVANFSLPYRSQVKYTFLVALFKTAYQRKYGWKTILQPLLDDLKDLELNGLKLDIKVRLCAIVADNLASHSLGGFSENFNTAPCRFCLMSAEERRKCTTLTCPEIDEHAVNRERRKFSSGESSIFTEMTPLMQLSYYSSADSHPPDISHDIFEGVGPRTLSLVLSHILLKAKHTSVQIANSIVESFQYSYHDKRDKPGPLLLDKGQIKVKQNMAECWTLLRLLPIMMGHLIQPCQEWSVLIHLIQIIEMIMAPVLTDRDVDLLDERIKCFMEGFQQSFPSVNFTPKFHFLLHYPSQIKRHGPLKYLSSIRFEQKNQDMKRKMEGCRCMRNVCKTMAVKHERMMAAVRGRPSFLLDGYDCRVLCKKAGEITRKLIRGVIYWLGCVVWVREPDVMPCQVAAFCYEESMYVRMLRIGRFEKHRNSFRLILTTGYRRITFDDLKDCHPFSAYGEYLVLTHFVSGIKGR